MNAGRILRDAGLDTPDLRAELAPVDPDQINVWPAARWLRKLWRKGIRGVTQGKLIMVDPQLLAGDKGRLGKLVVHELVHVKQFQNRGYLPFMSGYIFENLLGRLRGKTAREAYLDISSEREARDVVQRLGGPV